MRKRNRTISIRVSDEEYAVIQKKIEKSNQTQQAFILNAINGAKIFTARDTKLLQTISTQLADLIRQIKGMAVNINQMAHKANAYGDLPSKLELLTFGKKVEDLRKEADDTWQLIRRLISRQKHTEL